MFMRLSCLFSFLLLTPANYGISVHGRRRIPTFMEDFMEVRIAVGCSPFTVMPLTYNHRPRSS